MLGFLSPISSLVALYLTPAVTRAVRGQGERGATLDNIRLWPADRVLSGIYRNMNR